MSADAIERRVVIEVTPVIDAAGTKQLFLMGETEQALTPTDTPAEGIIRALLISAGIWESNLFGGDRMGGDIVPGGGVVVLNNTGGALDAWVDYAVDGALVTCRWGPPGAAYPAGYSTVYIAYGLSITVDIAQVTLNLRDRMWQLDKAMCPGTFIGSGGLEGDAVVAQRKQWVGGDPGFIPPVGPLSTTLQLYYVTSTGTGGLQAQRFSLPDDETITCAYDVFDGGVRLPRGADYASAAEMLSTAPAPGTVRLWFGAEYSAFPAHRLGPVYMRLGSAPTYELRVYAYGASPTGVVWRFTDLAAMAGLDIGTTYSTDEVVDARLVADDSTYIDVLRDAALISVSWFGFSRLDEFTSGRLREPAATATTVYRTTGGGVTTVTRPLHTFTEDNSRGLSRSAVPGMERPIYKVTMTSGDVWPCQLDPTASARMRDYLTRQDAWSVFTGVNPAIQAAYPGAQAMEYSTRQRCFQNTLAQGQWINRILTLFGGLRWVLTLEADMSDETLAIELGDNAVVEWTRMNMSGGRATIVVSKSIDVDNRLITFGLWGGTAGLGGYLTGGGGDDVPPVVNPLTNRDRWGPFHLLAASSSLGNSGAAAHVPPFRLVASSSGSTAVGNAILLLHGDTSPGLVDSSPTGRTITAVGAAAISTALSKFGSGSLYLPASPTVGYFTTPQDANTVLGTRIWSIDFQLWLAAVPTVDTTLFGPWAAGFLGYQIGVNTAGALTHYWGRSGVPHFDNSGTNYIPIGQWVHCAVWQPTVGGTIVYYAIDGVTLGMTTGYAATDNPAIDIGIGAQATGVAQADNLYMDEVRMCVDVIDFPNGVFNFTPPTAPYT